MTGQVARIAAKVTARLSMTKLINDETARSWFALVANLSLAAVWKRGANTTRPIIAKKLSWKLASHKMWGLTPVITAAAKASAVVALCGLPRYSAIRNRLPIMAPRTIGGRIAVTMAYSQIVNRASQIYM